MKKYIYILPFFFILFACDKIEEGDRILDAEEVNTVRPALLEDFTGQNCTNCPRATKRAVNIQKALGENMVIVGIHAGSFATATFKTAAGDAYQKKFYPSNYAYPAGMVDRTKFEGELVSVNDSKWGTYVWERVQKTDMALFDMSMTCDYNAPDKSFIVNCSVKALTVAPEVKLQLWITESHIIGLQKDGEVIVRDYEHNHVLRDAVNGIWGESINLNVGFETTYTSKPYSLAEKNWKPENMHVVAFIYSDNNGEPGEVLHVIEIPMLNN